MKAVAVFPQSREIKLIEHPEPTVANPTDVKIKMLEVGVCGTDREIWEFKYGEPPPGSAYLITGHESFGQVVEVGAAVKTVKVGDYVVLTVRRGCPENCISCANGQPDFCFTGHFTERGIKQRHGFMTEYVVDDEKYINVVPLAIKDYAVLLEPLTIAEKALMQIYHIQSRLHWESRLEAGRTAQRRHTAVVLGSGPVGLLGAMVLRLLGMDVHVVAREKEAGAKGQVMRAIGARYHSTAMQKPAEIASTVGDIDVIFEATGAASVSFEFMPLLGVNGIFIFTGVPAPMRDLTIDAGSLMRSIVLKNQVILGTVNAPKIAFENGLRHLAEFKNAWPGALDAMITDRLPLANFQETLTRAGGEGIKSLLLIGNSAAAGARTSAASARPH